MSPLSAKSMFLGRSNNSNSDMPSNSQNGALGYSSYNNEPLYVGPLIDSSSGITNEKMSNSSNSDMPSNSQNGALGYSSYNKDPLYVGPFIDSNSDITNAKMANSTTLPPKEITREDIVQSFLDIGFTPAQANAYTDNSYAQPASQTAAYNAAQRTGYDVSFETQNGVHIVPSQEIWRLDPEVAITRANVNLAQAEMAQADAAARGQNTVNQDIALADARQLAAQAANGQVLLSPINNELVSPERANWESTAIQNGFIYNGQDWYKRNSNGEAVLFTPPSPIVVTGGAE